MNDSVLAGAVAPDFGEAPLSTCELLDDIRSAMTDVETRLEKFISRCGSDPTSCPPGLAKAVHYAMFPGGARIRPRLAMAVALSCDRTDSTLAAGAAGAVELIHAASLVHDDLPCFDDSPMRRGKASVHSAFGERLAVLAGDTLIVHAFQFLAESASNSPQALAPLIASLSRGTGMPFGIAAGQAWECESVVPDKSLYQRAKTGALFAAATRGGAIAAGVHDFQQWTELGERLGEAYQIADDLLDAVGSSEQIGKPVGRDRDLGRPNMVHELGLSGAVARLDELLDRALDSIPQCARRDELQTVMRLECRQLMPGDQTLYAV